MEDEPICGVAVCNCICGQAPFHIPPHVCWNPTCFGEWEGEHDETFVPTVLPNGLKVPQQDVEMMRRVANRANTEM